MKTVILFSCLGMLLSILVQGMLRRLHSNPPAAVRQIRILKDASGVRGDMEVGRAWLNERDFAAYARRHGWSDIELKVKTIVGDALQRGVASVIAGEAPDLMALQPGDVARWYDVGLVEPLNDFVNSWADYRSGRINSDVLDMCRGADGNIICLAAMREGPMMYGIRRDWLHRLGLNAPTTWSEAHDVWKAFTEQDPDGNGIDDTFGYCIDMRTARGEHIGSLTPFMYAAGVRWFSMSRQNGIRPLFNTPQAAETLNFIKGCYKQGLFGDGVMYQREEFDPLTQFYSRRTSGMTAHIYPDRFKSYAMQFGMFDKVDLVPFLWKDHQSQRDRLYGTPASIYGTWCILRKNQDQHDYRASYQFLEYWYSRESQSRSWGMPGDAREQYLGRFGIGSQQIVWRPLRNDLESPNRVDAWIEELARPLDEYVVPAPFLGCWSAIAPELSEIFVDYYLDRYPSAQDALREAEQRFNRVASAYTSETHPNAR